MRRPVTTACEIGREMELLIARWSPVLQNEETLKGPFNIHKVWSGFFRLGVPRRCTRSDRLTAA
jgi:hypothetical protein